MPDLKQSLANRAAAPPGKGKTLREYLSQRAVQDSLATAARGMIDPAQLVQLVLVEAAGGPLAEATPRSVLASLIKCAQYGLEPVFGFCYILPYRNNKTGMVDAQFQLGYTGLIQLARRSGEVEDIYAEVVFEKDKFHRALGLHRELQHEPAEGDRGKPIGVYAVCNFKGGGLNFVYLTVADVEKYRQRSKQPDGPAWKSDWEAMAKKTAILRLRPYLPLSLQKAIIDTEPEPVTQGEVIDVVPVAATEEGVAE